MISSIRRAQVLCSIENVLELADGLLLVDVIDGEPIMFSDSFACPDCGVSIDEIEPRSFSFNNPFGACPDCFDAVRQILLFYVMIWKRMGIFVSDAVI